MSRWLIGLLAAFLIAAAPSAPTGVKVLPWSGILPADRGTDWTQAGAFDDWPTTRTTICATLTPLGGTSNDSPQISAAINACSNGVVALNAGTFRIGTNITWSKDYVSLRGSGASQTILAVQSTVSKVFLTGEIDESWTANTNHVVSAGYTSRSVRITTATAHGWVAGDFVLIDQKNNIAGPPAFDISGYDGVCGWCSRGYGGAWDRYQGQVVKILSAPTTTTAIFTPPLYQTYNASYDIRAVKAPAAAVIGISIEDLKIDNSSYYADMIFEFWHVHNSVISGVELNGVDYTTDSGIMIWRNSSFNTIKNSYWHNTRTSGSASRNYGLWLMRGNSNFLIVNNVVSDVYLSLVTEGAPNTATVFAYNYVRATKQLDNTAVGYGFIPHYNSGIWMGLFEGNILEGGMIRVDNATGSGTIGLTFYRNRVYPDTSKDIWIKSFDAESGSYHLNLVANVFGSTGFETIYECYNTSSGTCDVYGANKMIYRLGYQEPFSEVAPYDTLVKTSMFRHYNWDSVTNGTKVCGATGEPSCQGSTVSGVLAPSWIYTSKPAWFGSVPWPPIGPDVTGGNLANSGGHANKIPAVLCWDNYASAGNFSAASCYPAP
jgi:hypothetical protein